MAAKPDRLTPDQLVEAASELGGGELEQLVRRLLALRARRLAPQSPAEESSLLLEINRGLPAALQSRYQVLIEKRLSETLTPPEHEELLALTDQAEELEAGRAHALVELARLRRQPLSALLDDLGIKGPHAA